MLWVRVRVRVRVWLREICVYKSYIVHLRKLNLTGFKKRLEIKEKFFFPKEIWFINPRVNYSVKRRQIKHLRLSKLNRK